MKEILIIDDDQYIGSMLEEVLLKKGYKVFRAYSGTEAVMFLSKNKPDIILLDLMLPGLSGEEVLKQIKDIPVIVVSAKIDVDDKVGVLLGGAADYITKPFDTKELLARISVQLRNKNYTHTENTLEFDGIALDLISLTAYVYGKEIRLTKTEYAILKILIKNSTRVTTKSELLERIADDTPDCTENSLKIHVGNLRKKLKSVSDRDYIESVWGIGYKLKSA